MSTPSAQAQVIASGHKRSQSLVGVTQAESIHRTLNHLLLDVHAFIASPCRSGETAELLFSLYNHAENRFITEEFCLVLNHHGSPARDSEQRFGRLRSLFTDLKSEDVSTSVYLVCRIVRNGTFKMHQSDRHGPSNGGLQRNGTARRGSSNLLNEMNQPRTSPYVEETASDDSFSITSGFGGQKLTATETARTAESWSFVDARPTFRRPLGCAVIGLPLLTKLLVGGDKSGSGVEVAMPIYLPRDEAAFSHLHQDIISNHQKEFVVSPRAEAISITLKLFQGSSQKVVREHPALLMDVPITSRLNFPDVPSLREHRNELYVNLVSAEFQVAPAANGGSIRVRKGGSPSNHGLVQITIEVRRHDGTFIPDALVLGGSGEPPISTFHSLVFAHGEKPVYGELIKVVLPARVENCHLFLTFRSRSKDKHSSSDPSALEAPFAFAYLPLLMDGSCLKDGTHELSLYRMERNSLISPHTYLEASGADHSTVSPDPAGVQTLIPLRDRVTLQTNLCSTLHTQDDILHNLFQWQVYSTDDVALLDRLDSFRFVDEAELCKFVPRVLDSLFGILCSNRRDRQDEVDELVFKALSKVLAMSNDRRFPSFNPVLEAYVSKHFNFPASHAQLLKSMKSVMVEPQSTEYRAFLKIWHLFFRFVIRARELDRARGLGSDTTSKHLEGDFRRQTKSILSEINVLMARDDKSLIGSQALAVQHYADILPDLAQVFPPLEIAEIVIEFGDTVAYAKGSIAVYKMLWVLQVIKNTFDPLEARSLLIPAIVRWVKAHLGRRGAYTSPESQEVQDAARVKWMECNRLAVTVSPPAQMAIIRDVPLITGRRKDGRQATRLPLNAHWS